MKKKSPSLFEDEQEEWERLASRLRQCNSAYEEGRPLISDEEYDSLKKRLFEVEQIIGPQEKSPLYEVGADSWKNTIEHKYPMLSLDHGFGEEAIKAFIKRLANLDCQIFPLIAEHKVDGIALSLRYEKDGLRAVTRGNGKKGMDVTRHIRFLDIPKECDADIEVRGEMYMTFEDFESVKYKFSSTRNACIALIQSKGPIKGLKVNFVAYRCFGAEFETYLEMAQYLKSLGFKTPPGKVCESEEECANFFAETEKGRGSIPYPIDGIVLKINRISDWKRLGSHGTAPKFAAAVKFNAKAFETTIIDIRAQVGKSGVITPVAIFEQIDMDGIFISRATLHNFDEVKAKNYSIGDRIVVSRSGDAAPYVKSKIFDAPGVFTIEKCPSCGSELIRFEKTLRCPAGWLCDDQKIGRIQHFCSRNAFNIVTLGVKRIEAFVKSGYLATPDQIFSLEERLKRGEIALKDGWKKKSINNLTEGIGKSRNIRLANFLFALGIPNLGLGQANLIAKSVASFKDFMELYKRGEELEIKGIGKVLNASIRSFLESEGWIFNLEKEVNIH